MRHSRHRWPPTRSLQTRGYSGPAKAERAAMLIAAVVADEKRCPDVVELVGGESDQAVVAPMVRSIEQPLVKNISARHHRARPGFAHERVELVDVLADVLLHRPLVVRPGRVRRAVNAAGEQRNDYQEPAKHGARAFLLRDRLGPRLPGVRVVVALGAVVVALGAVGVGLAVRSYVDALLVGIALHSMAR